MGMTLKLVNLPDGSQVDIKNRVGQFSLPKCFADRPDVLGLMAYMLVTAADFNYYRRTFEIVAHSPLFDESKDGDPIPEYLIEFQKRDDGIYVKALRKNDLGPI